MMNNDHVLSRKTLLQDLALLKVELEVALDLLYADNGEQIYHLESDTDAAASTKIDANNEANSHFDAVADEEANADIKTVTDTEVITEARINEEVNAVSGAISETETKLSDAIAKKSGSQSQEAYEADVTRIIEKIRGLEAAYLKQLPKIPISRCPFSGSIIYKTIDTIDLDGPWWDYSNPVRLSEQLPETFLGFSGSMRLQDMPTKAPFTAMVGPSAPCILPELLRQPNIRAVLSTVKIGRHSGTIVSWFAESNRYEVNPPNEWGAPWCEAYESDGSTIQMESPFQLFDFDTELAGWIRNGKLLWIAPGDASLLLRADVDRCPYLDGIGDGRFQYIIDGQIDLMGMMDDDMRQETMTDEEFAAALKMIKDEEEGIEESEE